MFDNDHDNGNYSDDIEETSDDNKHDYNPTYITNVNAQDVADNKYVSVEAASSRRHNQIAVEKNDQITIEINHCLAYRKFAK